MPNDVPASDIALFPGQCFRVVRDSNGEPVQCPNPVVTQGWWSDAAGDRIAVEACEAHRDEIEPGEG